MPGNTPRPPSPSRLRAAARSGRPAAEDRLPHLTQRGEAHMVDVGTKAVTVRSARAQARLRMSRAAMAALGAGRIEKGDALAVARLAGIQAAKRTAELIPLCHPLPLDHVQVTIALDRRRNTATITSAVAATARTGVEMEALVAALAAAAALYDMLKAVDRAIVIEEILVLEKRGGKSGTFVHPRAGADVR